MAFDFQKLGLDRLSQNIARSVNSPVGSLVTGDITKGEVVEVTFDSESEKTAIVSKRRTGAIPINVALSSVCEMFWAISETTLTVSLNTSRSGTVSFWVF